MNQNIKNEPKHDKKVRKKECLMNLNENDYLLMYWPGFKKSSKVFK